MKITDMRAPIRKAIILSLTMLAPNAWGDGRAIQLNGFLEESTTDGAVRSGLRIVATPSKITATLQRRTLGTILKEARDMNIEFVIDDRDFIDKWRSQALVAFRQSPVWQNKMRTTDLPNGYLTVYVEEARPIEHDDQGREITLENNAWRMLIDTTKSKLNHLTEREEYNKIEQAISEGDTIKAIPISFEDILTEPQKWDGKRVKIVGWFSGGEEKSVIYPSRFHAWLNKKGVWVGPNSTIAIKAETDSRDHAGLREIEGIFRSSQHGHLGGYCGTIDRVTIDRGR